MSCSPWCSLAPLVVPHTPDGWCKSRSPPKGRGGNALPRRLWTFVRGNERRHRAQTHCQSRPPLQQVCARDRRPRSLCPLVRAPPGGSPRHAGPEGTMLRGRCLTPVPNRCANSVCAMVSVASTLYAPCQSQRLRAGAKARRDSVMVWSMAGRMWRPCHSVTRPLAMCRAHGVSILPPHASQR